MKRLTLIDKAFFLKKTPLFQSLDLDLLLPIADKLALQTYDANEKVFHTGEEGSRMYFLLKGTIQLYDLNNQLLYKIEESGFFGEEAIFNEKKRGYTALTQEECVLLTLSRTHLLTIISECPSVAISFLQIYTNNLPNFLRMRIDK